MEWLVLGALILIAASIIKWLTEKSARKLESKPAHKNEVTKLRLEPSARLPEVNAPIYSFQAKQHILTRAEQNFYKILSQGLSSQFIILMKVRVADVLQPATSISKSERASSFNQIKSKHFDFLLCSQNTYEIIAAVELDDRHHKRVDRKKRDTFLDAPCESASFPLIRITARQIYSAQEIKSAVLGSLRDYKIRKAA